jgi:hypothetical protein
MTRQVWLGCSIQLPECTKILWPHRCCCPSMHLTKKEDPDPHITSPLLPKNKSSKI